MAAEVAIRVRRYGSLAVFGVALLGALALEIGLERRDPLWLDEAWTIAIVGQRSWIDFYHQVYWDVNAPLYYLVMHLWTGVFGLSDAALRTPGLIFATATPVLIALWKVEDLPDEARLAWAALTALWFPGLCFAEEARCYALLLLFSSLQALAFIRLLRRPDTGRAAQWALFSALAILTHYDAILAGAVQGLVYLAVHRMRAVKTWPAALVFLPAFGWLAFHLPRIVEFARPGIAWYAPLTWNDMRDVAGFLAGRRDTLWGLLAVAIGAVVVRFAWRFGPRRPLPPAYLWLAPLAAAIAAATLVTIGFFRPSFAVRYLTPEVPGLLLGLVLTARLLAGRGAVLAYLGLIVAFGGVSAWKLEARERIAPHVYNYETASRWLERFKPARVVFLWDHPVDPILHRQELDAAGGAFFRRDGEEVTVDPVVLAPGQDPNARLLAEAGPTAGGGLGSRTVILWVYDTWVKGTAAVDHPPHMSQLDPAWTCRRYGRGRFGVYACAPAVDAAR